MRIVVLGAGTVGTSIAEMLCQHRHDVTVVDSNSKRTRVINDELDVATVVGSASQSSVLFQAGVFGCDLCLAVTGNDEVNLVAARMAKLMGANRTIARVYSPIFRDLSTFDYQRNFDIDRLLSLEHLSALEIVRAIRNPGSLVLESFARGQVEVHEVIITEKSKVTGVPLSALKLPSQIRLGSFFRNERAWIPSAQDVIEVGDHVTIIGRRESIDKMKSKYQLGRGPKRTVVVAGGGETGLHIARAFENQNFTVSLLERDEERCEFLASTLKNTTVVRVDATRRLALEEENVGAADIFIACTGDDENNIVACVEARDLGTKTIMAIIGRADYQNILGKLGIDFAISEREAMAKQVFGFLNTGPVISRTELVGAKISAYEIEIREGVEATQRVLAELELPTQCLIAAVIRGQDVYVPAGDFHLRAGDCAVLLIDDSNVSKTLKFFHAHGK